ncbi:MAG: GAF domain-containing protein [Planctomycetota bacterium]
MNLQPLDHPVSYEAAVNGVDRPTRIADSFRVLAVCQPGELEERLLRAAHSLGQEIEFARTFDQALRMVEEHDYDTIVVARPGNGLSPRTFVRQVKRTSAESAIVLAAPTADYEELADAMVEGGCDFLPDDADDNQLRLMLGRATDTVRLRRKSLELERALDARTTSLQERVRELGMLNDLSRELTAADDLDDVLDRSLERVLDAFGSESGSFMILDPEADELVVRAARGPRADESIGRRRKLGEGIAGKVARERHPVLVTDVGRDSRFRSDALGHYRSPSFIAVPLIYRGRLLGEMNVTEKLTGEPFSQDDLRLLSILAGQIASAIAGALAGEELRRANHALREKVSAARDELCAARGLADALVTRLPAAVACFDGDLAITFANESARELLGLEAGDSLRGRPAGSEAARLADTAGAALKDGTTRTARCSGRIDGCRADTCLSLAVVPLPPANGAAAGGTIVATARHCPLVRTNEKGGDPNE